MNSAVTHKAQPPKPFGRKDSQIQHYNGRLGESGLNNIGEFGDIEELPIL